MSSRDPNYVLAHDMKVFKSGWVVVTWSGVAGEQVGQVPGT